MRLSNFPLSTLKELPADAEVVSHQLMLRAGLIRKLAAGIYSWLPLGLRVLRKVERVVREEMDGSGALELLMPSIQPAELWQESERWGQYGPELLRITDRHQREFCYGPTHEEVITDIARRELQSYRQLPVNFYQIQTKFRDEIRPRFGVMRAREFMMKDAYSFHMDQESLEATYQVMHHTYSNIFSRLGLDYRAVQADTGSIGGTGSHEFHVLADSGEDAIAFSDSGKYAANVELAEALPPTGDRPAPSQEMTKVATPGRHSIEEVASYLNTVPESCLKTLIVVGEAETLVALVLRGDHELNAIKAVKLPEVADPLVLAEADQVKSELGCEIGSLGPVGLSITTYIDRAAYLCHDFVCGANENDFHLTGVNWERDLPQQEPVDIRNVATGDPSPDGDGRLEIRRGVEVGHIFQLGTKYSAALDVTVLDEAGKTVTPTMGCYGIGVSRVVAAAIEQNHDTQGIIWPQEMAPFQIAIVPIKYHKSERLRTEVDRIYRQLIDLGYEVLLDDRGVRPGVSFADLELIGIPHRLVVGERGLDRGVLEYKSRRDGSEHEIQIAELTKSLATLIRA